MIKSWFWNKPKIFISYRRDDSSGYTGRLFNDLVKPFRKKRIFMDIDTIEAGDKFIQVIEQTVNSCDVLIVVIGRNWLTIKNSENGERRIDNPKDFVRQEIATALRRDITVVPVLVQGASMPHEEDLPEDLKPLAERQAIELSDKRWQYDVEGLVGRLKRVVTAKSSPIKPTWRNIGLALAGAIVLLVSTWGIKVLFISNSNSTIPSKPSGENTNASSNGNLSEDEEPPTSNVNENREAASAISRPPFFLNTPEGTAVVLASINTVAESTSEGGLFSIAFQKKLADPEVDENKDGRVSIAEAVNKTAESLRPRANPLALGSGEDIALFSSKSLSGKEKVVYGRILAILIGIDKYNEKSFQLQGAVNDVKSFQKLIEQPERLLAGGALTTLLTDEKAKKSDILRELTNLRSVSNTDDLVVLYFSGHITNPELSNPVPSLVSHELEQQISLQEIVDALNRIKAKHRLIIIDG